MPGPPSIVSGHIFLLFFADLMVFIIKSSRRASITAEETTTLPRK